MAETLLALVGILFWQIQAHELAGRATRSQCSFPSKGVDVFSFRSSKGVTWPKIKRYLLKEAHRLSEPSANPGLAGVNLEEKK